MDRVDDGQLIPGFSTIHRPIWPIHLTFPDVGRLDVKEDVTPYEAVQLCAMLISGFAGAHADFKGHVEKHHLGRHFIK